MKSITLPTDEDEIARLYNEGNGIPAIGQRLGIHQLDRIRTILCGRADVIIRRGSGHVTHDLPAAGASLRQQLARRGLTQAEAARRIGISAKHMSQMVLGTVPIAVDFAALLQLVLGLDGRTLLHLQVDEQYDRATGCLAEEYE